MVALPRWSVSLLDEVGWLCYYVPIIPYAVPSVLGVQARHIIAISTPSPFRWAYLSYNCTIVKLRAGKGKHGYPRDTSRGSIRSAVVWVWQLGLSCLTSRPGFATLVPDSGYSLLGPNEGARANAKIPKLCSDWLIEYQMLVPDWSDGYQMLHCDWRIGKDSRVWLVERTSSVKSRFRSNFTCFLKLSLSPSSV